ncbi:MULTISPECIES: GNAT family N-acetyltransferase [Streptomyces]|uniref:GNAT family N-acetyltransferase n=1 Tax=Streptomyces katsurahamanus TaxID=2577098 RepID=A0ABW9NRS9_9ACTN|nr:GNAT family N-acetyltransferase [Streptomyces katsurahamanus]MQS36020.1 GNAT family N-acetyltransferase [Streptomyces katsurahamanus]
MPIRPAIAAELPQLQDIETAAGELFRALDMTEIADDEPPALDLLERYRAGGRAWVSVDDDDLPLAYLLHDEIDGAAHIEQVSVHPAAAHQRLGSGLIGHLAARAAAGGLPALTLTTFAEVPWNAPYYARLGFRTLDESELTDGLREIRSHERQLGLDRWPRVCMRREL